MNENEKFHEFIGVKGEDFDRVAKQLLMTTEKSENHFESACFFVEEIAKMNDDDKMIALYFLAINTSHFTNLMKNPMAMAMLMK